MQLVPGFNRRFDRSAAGGYLEVRPFDFHSDGPAATIHFLTPGPNIVGHCDHAGFDPNGITQILREGCLRSRGFSLARLNRTIVLAAGDLKVPIACFAEPLLQEGEGLVLASQHALVIRFSCRALELSSSLMTRFAVTAFLVANGVAKYFAIAHAMFAARRLGWRSAA